VTVAPDKEKTIKFPKSHWVAALHVPQLGGDDSTTFILKVEGGMTERALVNIEALRRGTPVTTFSPPLLLELRVRSGCKPSKPSSPDSSFYIYTMVPDPASRDTAFVEGHGDYDDPPFWKFWKHKRVTAALPHLSGYILAQGIVRDGRGMASADTTPSHAR
jgi:hypothetical protein